MEHIMKLELRTVQSILALKSNNETKTKKKY